MLENDVLVKIAKKHGKTPAQVLLRFINQKGMAVIPKSTIPRRIVENFKVLIYFCFLYCYLLTLITFDEIIIYLIIILTVCTFYPKDFRF